VSVTAFFDAARALKREVTGEGLTPTEVDAFNSIIDGWKVSPINPLALSDGAPFFKAVRAAFGDLTQSQVDGFGALLQAFGVARWPIAWAAYGIATAYHETAATMQPVREAYWLTEAWRKANLRYWPWYGRGLAQLTWKGDDKEPAYGYTRADEELGLNGALLRDPDLALKPEIAAKILVLGMEQGWFSTKKLADYLPLSGKAGASAFAAARRIINGTDKADVIAKEALAFQDALEAGEWR
jgi:putative chitinase